MPIHDWTRVSDAACHSFQLDWAVEVSRRLNGGTLPPSYFALTETVELRPTADYCALPEPDDPPPDRFADEFADPDQPPPRARVRSTDDRIQYACRAVTVRPVETHQPAAAILFVTRQDKETPYRFDALVRLAVGSVTRGIHLLVVDLFPPNRRNPQGVHKAIWDRIQDEPFELPPDKPLTLAAYAAGMSINAYVEPVAVGDLLTDMPIFLTPDRYVPCPLEETYRATWAVFPAPLKGPLEAPSS